MMTVDAQAAVDQSAARSAAVDAEQSAKAGPLAGIRVLDFTLVMAGPVCTRLLADLGADVIKVEPRNGDQIRIRPPLRDGRSTYFGQLNAGKQSIVVNLKAPEGIALAKRIAAASDVVVENFRPGVMKRLGIGYEELAAVNPRLIYCAISGFGQTGPSAGKPAYAPIVHAASGYDMAHMLYQSDSERPAKTGIFIADVMGGVYAFGAIQSALFHRERTGQGQSIDVSLMDSMLSLLVFEGQEAQFPTSRKRPLYLPLLTSDGYVIVTPVSQRNFERLADALGHPEWRTDPRFLTINEREQHWNTLMLLIEDWTRTRSSEECEQQLTRADVPCSRYRTIGEAFRDPQLIHRGTLATIDDGSGPFLAPNPPFQFSHTEASAKPFVSRLGADSAHILERLLGYTKDEIKDLAHRGVINE
jgi:CoA:oxalate CoA-transferase